MFTLSDHRPNRTCAGYSRREFLRVGGLGLGALGLGGLTLPGLLAAKAKAAEAGVYLKDRSVVLLFLQGGPTHIEFFDPKMSAPAEIRSITGEVKTNLPGVTFGGTFPKLAKMTDKLAIVRSYASGNGGHEYLKISSGDNKLKAAMSALYARIVGINDAATGMPTNVLVKPEAVVPDLKLGGNFETGALPTLTEPGPLGASFAAFDPSGGGELKQNLQLRITPERFEDRRGLLRDLDRVRRELDASEGVESAGKYQEQAFDTIVGGVADAFDWTKEDPQTIARYDTRPLFDDKKLQRWGDMRRTTNLLGIQMLMARRLCERGCGFVTVSDCGWDYHANGNSPKNMAGIYPMGGQVDHAVSAFIEDVHQRGLSDKILLVVTGEMGRTPRLNNNGGREHYGNLTSLLVSGGGLNMGQVVGQSDRTASEPATERYDPHHLMGTIMHSLFDLGQLRITQGLPKDVVDVITAAPVIPALV